MVYSAANSQQSNIYQFPTDKKVWKPFEVPTYITLCIQNKLNIKTPYFFLGRSLHRWCFNFVMPG